MPKIPGGYYLSARKASSIDHAPPHVREIWRLFLRKANYKDHGHIKRGQILISYEKIIEELQWYVGYRRCCYRRSQCETALKYLRKATMITTTRTTRGMIITILNYMYYQDPKNYENHNEIHNEICARTAMKPHDKERREEREEGNKESSSRISEGSDQSRLVDYLRNWILKNNPAHKFRGPLNSWDAEMEKIIRIDKRDVEEIKTIIEWCQKDSFWKCNIL